MYVFTCRAREMFAGLDSGYGGQWGPYRFTCYLTVAGTNSRTSSRAQDGKDLVSAMQVGDPGRATTQCYRGLGARGGEAGWHAVVAWICLRHGYSAVLDTDTGGHTNDICYLRDTGCCADIAAAVPGADRYAVIAGDTARRPPAPSLETRHWITADTRHSRRKQDYPRRLVPTVPSSHLLRQFRSAW